MENIFTEHEIPNSFLYKFSILKVDLLFYLNNNLYIENYQTFSWDLKTALKINVNGEYIY
jgi:hypothetical protein